MIYELRTYWAAQGKVEKLHDRFRNLTLNIFKKHQIELVGFWVPAHPTPDSGDLIYLVRFKDEAAMQKAWSEFRADPEWINGKAQSEQDGVLAVKVLSQLILPTNYSPLS